MTDLFGNPDPVAYGNRTTDPIKTTEEAASEIVPALFGDCPIRRTVVGGVVYYSIVDVVRAITGSASPRKLWVWAKNEITADGLQLSKITRRLKLKASDGKMRLTDCADQAGIILIIEYLHSPKAAPFRVWFSQLASERIEEIRNPDLALKRGYEGYLKKGMSPKKAMARARGVLARTGLTEEWRSHGIEKPKEFAMLTDRESRGIFGKTTSEMKKDRNLAPIQSLRDNMSLSELAAQFVGDVAISQLIEKNNPQGYDENAVEVDKGSAAGARVLADLNRLLEA